MTAAARPYLLAGDIGATKTALALFPMDREQDEPLSEETVENANFASFEDIVESFLNRNDVQPDYACFGAAGPVRDNRVKMTNLNWTLDANVLQQHLGIRSVTLINDLVSTAMGAVNLPAGSILTLNAGISDHLGGIGVIAPGTGLGEAFLIRNQGNWLPIPSEGGHSSFAPTNEQQRRLLHYMAKRYSHVSTEMVCSGQWLPHLYDFLCEEQGSENLFVDYPDPTRIIVDAALAAYERKEESIAVHALQLFTAILASECANLALKFLATGGVYIGGGLPPRILPFLKAGDFMQFFARGDYRDMLLAIPVHVILEPKTSLLGAAAYGRAHRNPAGNAP